MSSSRQRVVSRIARRVEQFPDLELAPLDASGLDGRDASLALAIDHAVARRWLTLQAVLSSQLDRAWDAVESRLRAVLLAGAAQCLLLDRVPDHAAINESAELARRFVRPGATGLVNAVLRKVADLRDEIVADDDPFRRDTISLGDGRAWRLREPVLSVSMWARCSERTSHPQPLLQRWTHAHGEEQARALAEHGLVHAPVIIAGCDHAPPECLPHERHGFWVHQGSHDALVQLLEEHPTARVQDTTSAAPVDATAALTPRLIVDACAGRGTKTRQLAALHPEARIIAAEPDDRRRAVLARTFAKSERVEVVATLDRRVRKGSVDLLVLDVPCSNTGVLARRVEARYRCTRATLDQLTALQKQIAAGTAEYLAADGHLLYATCSVEQRENQDQVQWLERHVRVREVEHELRLPTGGPGDAPSRYSDGGFWSLLQRS